MRKALTAIAIASILIIALALSGCTGQQGGTTNPTASPSTNPTTNPGGNGGLKTVMGSGSNKVDFSKASWWSWKEGLNMGSGDIFINYKFEHSLGTYNGAQVRKCKLQVEMFDGMSVDDYEYYYDANMKIVYAKKTSTIDLGTLGKSTEVIEVPEGYKNTTDDAKSLLSDIEDKDPVFQFDAYMHCQPVGNEQVTIAKGSYNCAKFATGEPLSASYMAYWTNDQAPITVKKLTTTRVLSRPTDPPMVVTFELVNWG